MTNFDRIKNRTVEEVAKHICLHDNSLMDEICNSYIDCPFDDDVQPSDCKNCVIQWLESEVDAE